MRGTGEASLAPPTDQGFTSPAQEREREREMERERGRERERARGRERERERERGRERERAKDIESGGETEVRERALSERAACGGGGPLTEP